MSASRARPEINERTVQNLKVLVADEDVGALRIAATMIRELGHEVTELAVGVEQVAEHVMRGDPDVSIVVVPDESAAPALDMIAEINEYSRGPVIAVLPYEHAEFIAEAARRGVDAFAREGSPESVQSAITVAVHRHAERRELADQV